MAACAAIRELPTRAIRPLCNETHNRCVFRFSEKKSTNSVRILSITGYSSLTASSQAARLTCQITSTKYRSGSCVSRRLLEHGHEPGSLCKQYLLQRQIGIFVDQLIDQILKRDQRRARDKVVFPVIPAVQSGGVVGRGLHLPLPGMRCRLTRSHGSLPHEHRKTNSAGRSRDNVR